jgi:DNA-binding XRE family transcriptional regulator
MRESLLTQATGQSRLAKVRSENRKGIVHSRILRLQCQSRQSQLAYGVPIGLVWDNMALLAQNGHHRAGMSRDVLVSFAKSLRRRRKELGLSQEQLGARANIQMADISRYESGSRDPRISTVARLAEALDTPIADLLAGPGD